MRIKIIKFQTDIMFDAQLRNGSIDNMTKLNIKIMSTMKTFKYFTLILLFSSLIMAQTYYVSSSSGNNNNDGKNENRPFKTIAKINELTLKPGDKILFKKGDTWEGEQLIIQSSGTENDPIIFSSYGSGDKPIISSRSTLTGWNNSSNWSQATDADHYPNVWQMSFDCDVAIDRLWLNGSEAKLASDYKLKDYIYNGLYKGDNGDSTTGVCAEHPFYFDNGNNTFYLYATSNPASYYSSVTLPGTVINGVAKLQTVDIRADYITFENIDVQGGMYTSIELNGADYITINNCNSGKYSNWIGIIGDSRRASDKTSDYITISNCIVDSDWDYNYVFYTQRTPYGVGMANGANNWEIFDNTIKDWWMSITVVAKYADVQYVNIYNNDISGLRNEFSKAMQTTAGGDWSTDPNTYVRFYNNYTHDNKFGVQISSKNNYFYGNIFENYIYTSNNAHASGAGGYASSAIAGDVSANPSDNYFFNNTFYNLRDQPHIYDGTEDGTFACAYYANNLYIETGTAKSTPYRIQTSKKTYHYNNIFYSSLFMSTSDKIIYYYPENTSYTVNELNDYLYTINSKKIADDNIHYVSSLSNLMNKDYTLPNGSQALSRGKDISSYVDANYKDRWGNTVNRTSPNVGAYGGNNFSENVGDTSSITESFIKILQPNGGEIWEANTMQEIKWESSDNTKKVHIYYTTDNANTWTQIASQENKKYFNWFLPDIESDQCIIRVKDGNDFSIFDMSDNHFKIKKNNSSTIEPNNLKVLLEAPFRNGKLNKPLEFVKNLPSEQPYNALPWNINDGAKITNIELNFIDWIVVELRDNLTDTKYSKPAILNEDGIVLNTDGSNFFFNNIASGEYYLVIKHRNHLGIISAAKLPIENNQPINYDFTDAQSKAYGSNPMIDLGNGKFGLFAGDGNADGIINNLDFGIVANNIPSKGYLQGDLDMNGIINVLDYSFINKNILKSSHLPK